ncbi:aldolase [Taklimakanibacter deserti]|uniref:aldolase n=1 Tax=Taklimakanibacter deserti TaxID=2267839 RepID=UPI000E65D02D
MATPTTRPRAGHNRLQEYRMDLAAAIRLAVRFGYHEGICNHFSLMVPGDEHRFLVNPYGLHWSEIRASDLVLVNERGEKLEGDGEVEESAFWIHSRIHIAHPAGAAVLHSHMPYATALTWLEDMTLEMAGQNAIFFHGRIAYDPVYGGLVKGVEEGDRIAGAMGDKRVLFMANHGVTVVGPTIAEAFNDLYYLERACQTQVLAMSTGRKLRVLPAEAASETRRQMAADAYQIDLHFAALKRRLDAEEPDYRD